MNIRLENLSKSFKDVRAVNNINLTIDDGKLVSLLGPSGCGKSTTLSMIAGLEKPSSGNIYFDGNNVIDIEPEKRGIGMVFQSYALYPHMTVLENIMFPLRMKKISKSSARDKSIEIIKLMHLDEYIQRKPGELSGGQQQRVAIARAIVKEPKILLLDEPLSNLDARLRIELREEIKKLQRNLKITTIFVTHDQEEAMSISDKIILMNNGVCQQYSTPREMYMNPSNIFVAGFLGNPPMNFIDGFYDMKNHRVSINSKIDKSRTYFNVNKVYNIDSLSDGEVIIGIRPEDLRVNDIEYDLIGKITSIQTLGKEVYIKIDINRNEISAVLPWEYNYKINDDIFLEIKKVHVFVRK